MDYSTVKHDGNDDKSAKSAGVDSQSQSHWSEEISMLKNADLQSNSHLFQLQASTLVQKVSLSDIKRKMIDDYLESLCEVLTQLPVIKNCKLAHCQQLFPDVKIPLSMKPRKVKGDMVFSPPTSVEVVGSYPLQTCLKQKMKVDLVLELPKECMQEKDFLNQRYLRKRATYLAYVAHYVKSLENVSSVMFSFFMENHQKPILIIKPSTKLAKLITIRCHICPPKDSLKPERFHPSKSNIRKSWFNGVEAEDCVLHPTPHYNSLVMTDMLLIDHREHIKHVLLNDSEEICIAIKLLKIWMQQRELDQGQGSFSGYLVTMVVIYLLKLGKINKSMSNFQVVRNVLQFLATSNWIETGLTIAGDQDLSEFHKHFEVVFMDPSGHLNLCYDLSTPVYKQIRREARLSVETLDNRNILNSFEIVFMTPVPFTRAFDHFLRVNKFGALRVSCQKSQNGDRLPEYNGDALSCTFSSVTSCLERGLNSRIELMSCSGCKYGCWNISQDAPGWDLPEHSLTYGFLLTSDATRIVDRGPVATAQDAPAFREFWGDKAELRQFKDGGIFESVVWNCDDQMQKRNLPEKICKHLLGLHFGLNRNAFTYIGSQMENVLLQVGSQKVKSNGHGNIGDEMYIQLDRSYNELCRLLRNLKDLPLSVSSIFGISAALRHTEVLACHTANISAQQENVRLITGNRIRTTPPYIRPVEILCHLESSGKWPQDVEASQRIKASFLLKMAEDLESSSRGLICVPSPSFLDVLKDDFVFRIMVTCPQELAVTAKSAIGSKSATLSMKLGEKTAHLPKIANALKGVSQGNETFGLVCRLAKQWIGRHLLSNHIPDVVTELLCAYLFVNSQPYSEPKSCWAAFSRFLCFLSSYDFGCNPVIVNFNDLIQTADYKQILNHFKEHRESLPAMYITTSLSPSKSSVFSSHISPIILNRLKVLASVSLRKLEEIYRISSFDFSSIFSSTTSIYDVVINLDPQYTGQDYNGQSAKRKRLSTDTCQAMADIGFDPAQYYLRDLTCCHSDRALFFHNEDEPGKIGVLWKKQAFADRDFKIGECLCHDMIAEDRVRCDVNAIIEDFRVLGDGLVKEIELHSMRWTI